MPQARVRVIKSNLERHPLLKADHVTGVKSDDARLGADGILTPPYPPAELVKLVEKSTILRQCIDAYKRNIPGFGLTPEYAVDEQVETPAMKAEWDILDGLLKAFSLDQSVEDLFGQLIEDREITGSAYLEVIRDGTGLPVGGERLDPCYMYVCTAGEPIQIEQVRNGRRIVRWKRFRKFVQQVGAKRIWFKEFGDPRIMDLRTGQYVDGPLDEQYQANEVIQFKIGPDAYGVPRWIGHLIHIFGARKAEELNYRYFTQGRHTPAAILLHNSTLTPESEQALIEYANSIEASESSQHKFLVIEAQSMDDPLIDDKRGQVKVEIKSLAEMLQQDALFLDYDEASRRKVQSAFRLPDIYVGRSTDFNRATADTARAITEEQVFEPERNSLEWVLNNVLLADYGFQYVRASFKKPEISNVQELVSVLNVGIQGKAVLPNDLRDIIGRVVGKNLEPLPEEMNVIGGPLLSMRLFGGNTTEDVEKAAEPRRELASRTEQLVGLLKDVRDVLEEVRDRERDR